MEHFFAKLFSEDVALKIDEDKKWAKNSLKKTANKPSLSAHIKSASNRAAESHSSDKATVKETTPER